ncbi:MAG TPA: hypothetical protein PLY45_05740, partial [bacterium]|nr:hypothetical protein [bacterium]
WVEEEILGQAGAGVSIEKFRFQLLPYPGYTIEGLELTSKSAPFQGQPLLRVEKARGSISFLSLIGGRIVTAVAASGVTVDYRSFGGASNLGALLGFAQGAEVVPSAIESTIVGAGEIGTPTPPPAPVPQAQAEVKALPMPSSEVPSAEPQAPPARGEAPGAEAGRPGPRTIAPPQGTEPGVQSPLSPSSSLMRDFILRSAFAEELSPKDDEASLEITSITVSNGRINFWEGGAIDFAIDEIALSAGNLSFSGGLGAEVRMRGRALGHAVPEKDADGGYSSLPASPAAAPASASLALSGRAFVDGKRKEFGLRGARLSVGSSQMSAEISVGYGQAPLSFDIHVATPGVGPRDASPALELMGLAVPSGLSWQGPASADISARGTRENFDLGLRIDGGQAKLSFSEVFTKGAGLPFKADLSMAVSPTSVQLKEGSVMLGQ